MAYTGKKPGNVNTDFLEAGGELANHDELVVSATGEIAQASVTSLATALAGKLDVDGDGSQLTGLAASFADLTDVTVATADPTKTTNPSATGHIWVNKTTGETFVCNDNTTDANSWKNVGMGEGNVVPYPPTGGTVTSDGGYTIHTFTSSGTFTVPGTDTLNGVEYLVVAGGGGGGASFGGGAGGGGFRTNVSGAVSGRGAGAEGAMNVAPGSYTVTVGAGGTSPYNNAEGNPGGNSSFNGITSTGGGGGGCQSISASTNKLDGGCGGGPSHNSGGQQGYGTQQQQPEQRQEQGEARGCGCGNGHGQERV